jgi:hypothetical protein
MYYLIQLLVPLIAPLALAIASSPPEFTVAGLLGAAENFVLSFLIFSVPHWIWFAVSGYFSASETSTIGGLFGLNALLGCVTFLVVLSSSHEAANGWFLYFLGAPIAIALGVVAGRYFASSKNRHT